MLISSSPISAVMFTGKKKKQTRSQQNQLANYNIAIKDGYSKREAREEALWFKDFDYRWALREGVTPREIMRQRAWREKQTTSNV